MVIGTVICACSSNVRGTQRIASDFNGKPQAVWALVIRTLPEKRCLPWHGDVLGCRTFDAVEHDTTGLLEDVADLASHPIAFEKLDKALAHGCKGRD